MQTAEEEIEKSTERGSNERVEIMRTELREDALIKRKEDRAFAWSKNRTNLGVCRDEPFSTEYINERAKLLKKKRISLEDYRYLPNALIQSEENISAFLRVDQSLSCLVRDLSGNSPNFQLYAANCCCNIALGSARTCTVLGKAVVPYLLTKLDSLNYVLLDVCIWTIGNLVAGSNNAFSILHAQHCLKRLILLLHNCNDSVLLSVVYTLLHYVHVGFHSILESEMAELVEVVKKRNLMYEHPNFIWLLALLSSSPTCTAHLHSILPQVVDYLYSATSDETTHANEHPYVYWLTRCTILAKTKQVFF
ncbi:uncharacterized protein LOC105282701 isoform X2 [Ooceraea biroi]|uniref:uncharacterized protein LOC105282701 isoform X2 n=1 Tax=Ooceraea biroi TaxID=2015173 RepID=UPI000F075992|nr:uncharacterized protein LOC105282701 isoform X2 [Ooceraea biroi]